MLRALSLYLPRWSVDLLRRRDRSSGRAAAPGEAILLTRTERQRPVVAACCDVARRTGVRLGMTIADAGALLRTGTARIVAERPERDAIALQSLARWASRFSPLVAVDPPDGLLLNVTGCAQVFRGEDRLLGKLLRQTERLGCAARAAIAPTYGAAWAIARYGPASAILTDRAATRAALESLPIRSLRIEGAAVVTLHEVGITRIGELAAVPRTSIPSRFGVEVLEQLDRAFGLSVETIDPVRAREPIRLEWPLDGPTTDLHALGIVTRRLLEGVVDALTELHAGARRLQVIFDRPRIEQVVIEIVVGRPSRDARHLWSLLAPRLERLPMGDGVERVEVYVPVWSRLRDVQATPWAGCGDDGSSGAPAEIDRLCDTLANRLGRERVCTIRLTDTHIPERAWRIVPRDGGASAACQQETLDRPTLLLPFPEPIRTIAGSGYAPPWRIAWRGHDLTVSMAIGPERIGEAWWNTPSGPAPQLPDARDYFKVQAQEGRWLWVFRETDTNRWFVHGVWA